MYLAELKKVTKKLKRLFRKIHFEEKKIYLFGVSENSRQIIKILRENGYEPIGVIDNDTYKIGSFCAGLKVRAVTEIPVSEDTICLIYSFFNQEMKRQLQNLGLFKRQVLNLAPKAPRAGQVVLNAFRGKIVYNHLVREYGDVPIFLCPYTGTGDVYLIGTFWEEYIISKGIEDYVFVVISGACKKVAQIFDIKNVVCLRTQKECGRLLCYYALCPDKVRLKILNDAWAQINDNSSEWFRGYKGWYFTELFRKFVFDLPAGSKPKHPAFKDVSQELDQYSIEYGLPEGKTVVLSPYSNTLSDMPTEFWEDICNGLSEKGYVVCTNSSGPAEPAINGSKGIYFPLNIAPQFVERAGAFIGIRSGFCDVISGANAKKIILYDAKNRFYNCSAYEYFSLKKMGLCDDAIEIEFDHEKLADCISLILNQF